jgi:predicted NAD/FAD-dependent oxidoreductase
MKIAILGSGVAGLSAARTLRQQGIDTILFDKSRGVGGRMSTRYAGVWEFDHGAQFFTVQDPNFQLEIDAALKSGVAAPWDAKALYLGEGEVSPDKGRDRYVGQPRMNSLPKYWAKDFDVRLGKRVTQVQREDSWNLGFEDGTSASGFDGVISTLPPAQAALLLPAEFAASRDVHAAQMHVCFCLMVGLDAPLDLGWDSLRVKNLPIDWIAINSAKPGRARTNGAVVVHSEAAWSDAHVDADRDWIQNVMLDSASALLERPLHNAPHIALHRWLYASNKTSPNTPCFKDKGYVVAGDWCLGGRVQGAWLSGRAAAQSFL